MAVVAAVFSGDSARVDALLTKYKDLDLDFAIDAKVLEQLLGGDVDAATCEKIVGAMSNSGSSMNALNFVCGLALACKGGVDATAASMYHPPSLPPPLPPST